MMSALSIGLSGIRAAEARLEVSANNVANVRSAGAIPTEAPAEPGAETAPVYKPQRVENREAPGGGVSTRIVSDTSFQAVYDADASYADKDGMVAEPKIDLAREAVEQISAQVQFSANLKTVQSAITMSQQLLSLRA